MTWKRTMAVALLAACGDGTPQRDPEVTNLQVELLGRVAREQGMRDSVFLRPGAPDAVLMGRIEGIDRDNTSWLKEQVAAHGWPSRAKVGDRASQAAFLIVQHATHDPAFQRQMLDTLTLAWQRGEVDGESYALLYDRVQSQAGQKQRYGTQARMVGGALVFDPIEDSANVDSLRRTVGLPSLAAYRRVLDSVYRLPSPPRL